MKNTLIPLNRPADEEELNVILRRAYDFAKKSDYESALALCDWLIEDDLTRVASLRKRAAIREHQDHVDDAIADLENVIQSVANEPADSYSLGSLYLQQQNYEKATALLRKCVQQCEVESFDYYLNPCRMLLAYSLIRQKELKEARAVLQRLPAGYSAHIYNLGNKTKEDLLQQVT